MDPTIRIFLSLVEVWYVPLQYYNGGCVTKVLNLLEYIVFIYEYIIISSQNKYILIPGLRFLGIISISMAGNLFINVYRLYKYRWTDQSEVGK